MSIPNLDPSGVLTPRGNRTAEFSPHFGVVRLTTRKRTRVRINKESFCAPEREVFSLDHAIGGNDCNLETVALRNALRRRASRSIVTGTTAAVPVSHCDSA